MVPSAQSLMLDELELSDAQIERPRHGDVSLLGDRFGDSSLVTLFADRSELQAGAEKAAINGTADELDLLLAGADENKDLLMDVERPFAHGIHDGIHLYLWIVCF